MGIEIGAGLSHTRTGSDFIVIPISTTERYWFSQNSLWVTHEVAPQPRNVSLCFSTAEGLLCNAQCSSMLICEVATKC